MVVVAQRCGRVPRGDLLVAGHRELEVRRLGYAGRAGERRGVERRWLADGGEKLLVKCCSAGAMAAATELTVRGDEATASSEARACCLVESAGRNGAPL